MASEIIPNSPERIEGIQLCVMNARRLIEDSDNVSGETAIVLLELALEEVAKGFMLVYRGTASEAEFKEREQKAIQAVNENKSLDEEEKESVKKFYYQVGYNFVKDISVQEFENHKDRLDYLSQVISLYTLMIGPAMKSIDLSKLSNKIYGSFMKIEPKAIKEGLTESIELIKKLNTFHIQELREIREKGLYVAYENSHFFYPTVREIHLEYIEEVANLMTEELESVVNNFRKT